MEKLLVTAKEAGELLSISEAGFRRVAAQRGIAAVEYGLVDARWRVSDLKAYVEGLAPAHLPAHNDNEAVDALARVQARGERKQRA